MTPAPLSLPPRLIRFNKPYGVLSQFTAEGRWRGLSDFIDLPGVYVAGRLDADSEGLLLLTSDGKLQARIADPRFKMEKTYWVQVEGVPDDADGAYDFGLGAGFYVDATETPFAQHYRMRSYIERELPELIANNTW